MCVDVGVGVVVLALCKCFHYLVFCIIILYVLQVHTIFHVCTHTRKKLDLGHWHLLHVNSHQGKVDGRYTCKQPVIF